jgi:hypothetical protein
MLGVGFDTDPIYWWAGESLSATQGLGEEARVVHLLARSLEHIDESLRTAGDQSERKE